MKLDLFSRISFRLCVFGVLTFSTFNLWAATPTPNIKLGLNWKAEPEFGGFYQAKMDHLFDKKSLTVDITEGGAGTPTIQMVASGKIDMGTVSADELVLSRAQGNDLVAVFAVYQKAPYVIMTHASEKFKTLSDLFASTNTLSIVTGLPLTAFLERKFGFKTVKIVPYIGGIANFIHDSHFSQQGFVSSEPRLAKKRGIDVKVFLTADEGFNPYVTVVVMKRKFLTENSKKVADFVGSLREGWRGYLDSPTLANKELARLNPTIDSLSLAEMAQADHAFIETEETKKNGLGTMTLSRWKVIVQQMQELRLISKPVRAEECFQNF